MESFFANIRNTFSKDAGRDDERAKSCYDCNTTFDGSQPKYPCNLCAKIYCDDCSKHTVAPPASSGDQAWLRVCNYCELFARLEGFSRTVTFINFCPVVNVLQFRASAGHSDSYLSRMTGIIWTWSMQCAFQAIACTNA